VNFNPAINTVGTAAFGIPADLNVQFDRPEFERSINFLLGRVGRITRGFASDGEKYVDDLYRVKAQYGELEFYFQDTWKVRRNLTLDLGIRWELRNEPGEANDLIARPNQTLVYGAPSKRTTGKISHRRSASHGNRSAQERLRSAQTTGWPTTGYQRSGCRRSSRHCRESRSA
jgi:hypothetical protein